MELPWWLSFVLAVTVLVLASELGFRIARRSRRERAEGQAGPVGVAVAALLALLGLLLAFSFSSVDARFDARKALVLEDANAIGTAYLRAGLLPEPHDERARELLRTYVSLRLAVTPEELADVLARTEQVQRRLWDEALAIEALEPRAQSTGLFINALNEVIDTREARLTVAFYQRLPGPVRIVLYLNAILALGVVGFSAGLARACAPLAIGALALAVGSVLTLITELDRTVGSAVGVSQQALVDTARTMARGGG
jgi:hypothetical protein